MVNLSKYRIENRKPLLWASIGVVIVLIAIVGTIVFVHKKPDDTVIIVLSPHYDDAVLSLGGMLAMHMHPEIVATFFTGEPILATSTSWDKQSGFTNSHEAMVARLKENTAALKILGVESKDYGYLDNQYRTGTTTDSEAELEREIAQDIQALIVSYGDKNILIYGPSIFTPAITHPDHALLHQAFSDVMQNYPKKNIDFFYYEDYPYIARFNKEATTSLETNLEKDTGHLFDSVQIPLTSGQVHTKQKALEKYTSQVKSLSSGAQSVVTDAVTFTQNRCGVNIPCEVVYKLFKASSTPALIY